MGGYTLGHITLLALPVLLVLVDLPLAFGLVSRNQVYGIRTARSLATDASWYAINKRGGWAMVIASLVALGLILTIQKRMPDTPSSLLLQVGVLSICLAVATVFSITLHG